MLSTQSGIYMMKNKRNGKVYIGQSQNIQHRHYVHLSLLRRGLHPNTHLQSAWNKYGENSFEFSIIEFCDLAELDEREMYYICEYDSIDNGYNQTAGGGGIRGYLMSDSAREKMSKSHSDVSRSNNPRARSIMLLNTGEVFDCIQDASTKYSVCKADISKNAKRKSHSAGEYHGVRLVWAYADEAENMSDDMKLDLISTAQNCKRGENCHRSKPVICLSTGNVYYSCRFASQETGIHEACISAACRGIQSMAGGMEWAYYTAG